MNTTQGLIPFVIYFSSISIPNCEKEVYIHSSLNSKQLRFIVFSSYEGRWLDHINIYWIDTILGSRVYEISSGIS